MIETLVPAAVAAVEAFEDPPDAGLYPQEQAAVAGAVDKRRREFGTARWCARQAMARLGVEPVAVLSGPKREPLWPAGVVGSITHCAGYRAAALARASDIVTIGIDAEPNEPMPDGVLGTVSLPGEAAAVAALLAADPAVRYDRLLFCAKEAVYKAWYPLAGRWLGFEDAEITLVPDGTFQARLLVPGPVLPTGELRGFAGRWLAERGLLLATIAATASLTGPP